MRAVILTASSMKKEIAGIEYSGKCVTAFDLERKRIVRFVQNEQGAPIGNPFCNKFHPLDLVEIKIHRECPLLCQTENVLADYRNVRILGKYDGSIEDIYDLYARNNHIFPSYMCDGSYKVDDISSFDHSLEIVYVSNLVVENKKCSFICNGRRYKYVSVTDPEYTSLEKKKKIGNAYLAVSIPTNEYQGNGYYKFVASIFPV